MSSAVGGAQAECARDHSHLVVRSQQAAFVLFKIATLENTFKKGKAFKGILYSGVILFFRNHKAVFADAKHLAST